MNGPRYQFLASAGFTDDEYGGIGRRDLLDLFKDTFELNALTNNVGETAFQLDLLLQGVIPNQTG